MAKRWTVVALVMAGLTGPVAAQSPMGMGMPQTPQVYQAQFAGPPITGMPSPQFAAPAASVSAAQFCPDTSPAALAAEDDCCIPKGNLNAFIDDTCCPKCGVDASAGVFGLLRQSLNGKVLGLQDPLGNPAGTTAPAGSPAGLNVHDVDPQMHFGGQASVLVHNDQMGIEVTGFYTSYNTESRDTYTTQQPLTLLFAYNQTPAGFAGIYNNVDYNKLSLQSAMGNVEANFRLKTIEHFEFIAGVRYLDYQERYSIFTDTDSFINGIADPATQANYSSSVHNRIATAQIGFECTKEISPWVTIVALAKGGAGPNFVEMNWSLERGDNGASASYEHNHTQASGVFEFGLFADMAFNDRCKLRAGYQGIWLVDVPEAASNIDLNLTNTGSSTSTNSSIFFHGPSFQLEFSF